MNNSLHRYFVLFIILGLALFPRVAHAVVKNLKVEISPVTEKSTIYNQCKYYLPATTTQSGEECTMNSSIAYWEVFINGGWKTYYDAYFLIPSYGDNATFTGKGSDTLYWYESSFVPFFILTSTITKCPTARALANYDCVSTAGSGTGGTGGCTPIEWYFDCDQDGFGDTNLGNYTLSCTKPPMNGTCTFADKMGDDCDYDPQTQKKYTYCVDSDDDWWPSSVTALSCNCTGKYYQDQCKPLVGSGKPSIGTGGPPVGYAVCASELNAKCATMLAGSSYCADNDYSTYLCSFCHAFLTPPSPVSDCDDANSAIGGEQKHCADQDGDGYCCANPDNKNYCSEPPGIVAMATLCPNSGYSPYIPLAASKGPDACDQVKGQTVAVEECMDADGDTFGNPNMCKKQCLLNPWDSWIPKSNGVECAADATHSVPDEDPTFNPKQKWVIDCDGDGYYPEKLVKTGCTPPPQPDYCKTIKVEDGAKPVMNYVLLKSPTGKALKPGDCADQWFKMYALTTWGTDVDDDGYYDISKNIVQCKDPDEVENQVYPQCADSADPDCAAKAKAYPYKMLSKVDWKAGDCDDADPAILDIMWQFADWDMDGLGDPLNSTVTHCTDTTTSDSPAETTPAYGEMGVQYPMVKHPDDLTPNGESLSSKIFFVAKTLPLPCEEQFKQGKTTCLVPGSICRYEPSAIFPDLSCLPEAFRGKYCPTFGTLYDGSEQPFCDPSEAISDCASLTYSLDLSNLFKSGQVPFGTTRPILSEKQFSELAIMPTEINTSDSWPYYACLFLDSFKKTSFFGGLLEIAVSPMGGWVSFPATTWAVLKLNPGSGQSPANATQVFSLLAAAGNDYTLALDALSKPGYEKWNAPRVASLPKAAVAEIEIPAIPAITTLEQLLQTTKNLNYMPYPIPVMVKSGPNAGTIQCVYYGELYGYQTQCKFGYLSDPRHGPKLADFLNQQGVLPEESTNLTDSDGDKVTDVAEVNLPYLNSVMGAGFSQKIAWDASIKPMATGPAFENIVLNVNLTPEESTLLNEAKKRALDILPEVFERSQKVFGGYLDAELLFTLPQWTAFIQNAVPRWVWGPPALYEGTSYATNWGLTYLISPITVLTLKSDAKNASGAPMVNLWLIQKYALQQGLDPTQAMANTMIHTILSDHVVMDAKMLPLKKALIKSILEEWGGEVYIPSTPEILP